MFGRPTTAHVIDVGDRFLKVGDLFGKMWEVSRVWMTVDGLLHARVVGVDRLGETRIISISALTDRQFFVPVVPLMDE